LQINPNGLATVFGARRRNWREVGERVARLASGLRALGANPGDRVAILSLNSDRYLELYLAIAWAGAVVVPLNIRWSPLENEDAMRDCRANVLIVDKAFSATGAGLAKALTGLKLVYADEGAAGTKRPNSGRDARGGRPCRNLLHRRHHRPLEGRHAQPR
jgi:long-chain acyl-CoA synthetase